MDVTGQDTLARAAFTLNKERNARTREFLDFLAELLHDRRTAKDHFLWWRTLRAQRERNSLCTGQNHSA